MRRAAPVTHVKRTGKGAGREIFGIHELQTESFQFRLKSCFSQNTPFLTFLDCLLTNQDMGDLKGYSSSCSPTYFTDEESSPEGFQVVEEPRKETQVS